MSKNKKNQWEALTNPAQKTMDIWLAIQWTFQLTGTCGWPSLSPVPLPLSPLSPHAEEDIYWDNCNSVFTIGQPNNLYVWKLDGVGPIDNKPSTDKLHHFVWKKINDMWHVTCDMWHMTCDTWHMTRLGGVNILSKFQLPSSSCLWFMLLWRSGGKGSLNQSVNESRGCL